MFFFNSKTWESFFSSWLFAILSTITRSEVTCYCALAFTENGSKVLIFALFALPCHYMKLFKNSNYLLFVFSLYALTAFELTFLTSDKQHAGTTQNAWIVLEGEERKSQEYQIENSPKNKVLRRGQTDSFKFVTKNLGSLTHVTVGHRRREGSTVKGTGKETGWFLHELIVTQLQSGEK